MSQEKRGAPSSRLVPQCPPLSPVFFPGRSPPSHPSRLPSLLTRPGNPQCPRGPLPPSSIMAFPTTPFPQILDPLPPSRAPHPYPSSSWPSLGVPRTPGGLPAPLASAPGARGALWNRPGPSTPARERYHAGASEQLSRLCPPASKSLSDWPDLSREGGTRRGSHPLVAGAPGAPVDPPGPAPARSAQARPRPPARRGRPRPAPGPAPPPGGGPHLLRAPTDRPARTPGCTRRRPFLRPALRASRFPASD